MMKNSTQGFINHIRRKLGLSDHKSKFQTTEAEELSKQFLAAYEFGKRYHDSWPAVKSKLFFKYFDVILDVPSKFPNNLEANQSSVDFLENYLSKLDSSLVYDVSKFNKIYPSEVVIAATVNSGIMIKELDSLNTEITVGRNNQVSNLIETLLKANSSPILHYNHDINSRGFYKMHCMINQGLKIKGNILDLTCGAGGMTQRMLYEQNVSRIYANTRVERSSGRKKYTPPPHKTHLVTLIEAGSGDITSNDFPSKLSAVPQCDLILMDCAEFRDSYEAYGLWFLNVLYGAANVTNSKLKIGGNLLIKLFTLDEGIDEKMTSISRTFESSQMFLITPSFITNSEVYILFKNFKGANAKTKHNYIKCMHPYFLFSSKKISKMDSTFIHLGPSVKIVDPSYIIGNNKAPIHFTKGLEPMDFSVALSYLEKNYGRKECEDEQIYSRFHNLMTLSTPLDINIGSSSSHEFFPYFNYNVLSSFGIDHSNWTVTSVTPFHEMVTIMKKYDRLLDTSTFDWDDFVIKSVEIISYLLGSIRCKVKTYEETWKKMVHSDSKHSSTGRQNRYMGSDVLEVLSNPDFRKNLEDSERLISKGIYPPDAIINTMGKFERKEKSISTTLDGRRRSNKPDSRMIFYGSVIFRFLERKYTGDLASKLIDPSINKLALGHASLTEYGRIINDRWIKLEGRNPRFVDRDISGWDTCYNEHVVRAQYEIARKFVSVKNSFESEVLRGIYRIYSNSLLLLTRPQTHVVNKLERATTGKPIIPDDLSGLPKQFVTECVTSGNIELSGKQTTYAMNTTINTILVLYQIHLKFNMTMLQAYNAIEGVISGDDALILYPENLCSIVNFTQYWTDSGFIRKGKKHDEADTTGELLWTSSFCSNSYQNLEVILTRISDGKEIKRVLFVPFRSYSEIFGKFKLSLNRTDNFFEQLSYDKGAAISFLVLYVGMRYARSFFLAVLESIPVELKAEQERNFFGLSLNVKELNFLNIIKEVYFPNDYEDFYIKSFKDIGYIPVYADIASGFVPTSGNEFRYRLIRCSSQIKHWMRVTYSDPCFQMTFPRIYELAKPILIPEPKSYKTHRRLPVIQELSNIFSGRTLGPHKTILRLQSIDLPNYVTNQVEILTSDSGVFEEAAIRSRIPYKLVEEYSTNGFKLVFLRPGFNETLMAINSGHIGNCLVLSLEPFRCRPIWTCNAMGFTTRIYSSGMSTCSDSCFSMKFISHVGLCVSDEDDEGYDTP